MKYLLTFFTVLLLSTYAYADTTSSGATTNTLSNSSGSNTTNSYTGDTRVTPSASAPSISAMSQDLCKVGVSAGVQTFSLGISGGTTVTDENCERMKLSKLLYDYNMKVAAVAILCQDDRVFSAMENAGTPCPFEGMIGEDAKAQWKKYDKERPDYDQYTEKLKIRNEIETGNIVLTQEILDDKIQMEQEELKNLELKLEKSKKEAEQQALLLQKELLEIEKENEKIKKKIEKEEKKKKKLEEKKKQEQQDLEDKKAKLEAERLAEEEAEQKKQQYSNQNIEIFKDGR